LSGIVVSDGFFVDAAGACFVGQTEQVHGSLAKLGFRGKNDLHSKLYSETRVLKK